MTTQPRNWQWMLAGCMFAASVGLFGTICLAQPPNDSQRGGQRGRPNNPQGGAQQSQQRPQGRQGQPQQSMQQQQRSAQQFQQQQPQRFNPPAQQQNSQQFSQPQNTRSQQSPQGNPGNPNLQRFQGGRATAGGAAGGNAAGSQPNSLQQPGGARDRSQPAQNGQSFGGADRLNANSNNPAFRQGTQRQPFANQNPNGAAGNKAGGNPGGQTPLGGNNNAKSSGPNNTARSRNPGGGTPPFGSANNNPNQRNQTGANNNGGITGSTIPGANIPPRRPTASNNPGTGRSPTDTTSGGGTFDRGKLGGNNNPGGNGNSDRNGRFNPRPGDVGSQNNKNTTGAGQGTRDFPRRPTAGDDLKLGGNKNNPTDKSNNPLGGRGRPGDGKAGTDGSPQIGDAGKGKGPTGSGPVATGDKDGRRGNSGRDRFPGGDKVGDKNKGGDSGKLGDASKIGSRDKLSSTGRPHRDPTLPPRGSGFQVDASKVGKDNNRGPGRDSITNKDLQKVAWKNRVDDQRLQQLTRNPQADKIKLAQQYQLHDRGDVGRRMGLHQQMVAHGGWDHRHMGWVNAGYHNHCFERPYWGPAWYPSYCYYPRWSTWVSWSWGYACVPLWDPRPIYCRPVVYEPCVRFVYYDYPVWQPLPVATCGTWVDVEPVAVEQGNDLELLAVRFVDPGYPEQNKGPRYRAWLRNNSNNPITQPFNVLAMGTPTEQVTEDRLETGQRIPTIDAGQTIAVDLRFPVSAADDLDSLPELNKLHILVDSHREIQEVNEANNGVVLDRGEIMSVDPVAFGVDAEVAETGGTINLAGEGLGPEPGQVLLQMDGEQQEIEVLGWYDLGVQVQLPEVQMGDMTKAEIVVVRGDGAATNPLPLQIVQAGTAEQY